ncbi:MAG: glycosyl transferase [Bacilli bacterium]|nr:glycosyl transferase [Bacilli bacterium]
MGNPNLKENKFKRALVLPFRGIVKTLFPITYVKLQYKYITHHKLNLKNPKRYTEKLQYLRLFVYPKNPLVSKCASRDGVREYVSSKGYEDTLIPSYGVYDSFDDIDFDKLPNQFVMKCTHACAFNKIIKDKENINKEELRKTFNKWLKTNYGKKTREMHYSPIKPRIIVEKYIGELEHLPAEYKIHVFNGVAKNMYVVTGRGEDIRYNNYYIDWTPFDGSQFNGWKKRDEVLPIPENWNEMVKMAETLSKEFPFVRVDLYNINGKIYFGEMTFTPAKGTLILDDDRCDFEMGEWLDINN